MFRIIFIGPPSPNKLPMGMGTLKKHKEKEKEIRNELNKQD